MDEFCRFIMGDRAEGNGVGMERDPMGGATKAASVFAASFFNEAVG